MEELFDAADADGDGRLRGGEAEAFREGLRGFVADALLEVPEDDEVQNIVRFLRDCPPEGLTWREVALRACRGQAPQD